MTEPRPWLTIRAPCPVCKVHFELTQPMADHMSDHSVEELEAAGLKVTVVEEYTGCTEPGCKCENAPYEGCDCPPEVWSNVDGVYEAAYCVVSARYNTNGETPLCHDCEHFTSSHVVNEKVKKFSDCAVCGEPGFETQLTGTISTWLCEKHFEEAGESI